MYSRIEVIHGQIAILFNIQPTISFGGEYIFGILTKLGGRSLAPYEQGFVSVLEFEKLKFN